MIHNLTYSLFIPWRKSFASKKLADYSLLTVVFLTVGISVFSQDDLGERTLPRSLDYASSLGLRLAR